LATLKRSITVSILFTLFGGPGLVLVIAPWWLTRLRVPAGEPAWQIVVAATLMAAGVMPLLESIWRFVHVGRGTLMPAVPTEHLVVSGLYRFVRNPMYVGVLTALAGEALLFERWNMVIYWAVVAGTIHLFVLYYEEPTLSQRYGEEYEEFKRMVPRWLPRLTPWKSYETRSSGTKS
jgi:protein-S-isoprenylcysteine O-methyltransferase Ste14